MKWQELIQTGEGVSVAVVNEGTEDDQDWNVYLINTKAQQIKNVLVTSNGYGELENKRINTSTIRWYFDELPPHSFAIIEPIMEEVFGLNNEYWVSYYIGEEVYDKKFVFLPETIQIANFVNVPLLNKKGVLIN